MNATKNIATCLSISLACLMLMSQAAYAAIAGHAQFVIGNVQIVNAAGQVSTLRKGDAVNEGDTLTSAKTASAQIKMQDGGFIAMRPDTKLKFDSFVFNGKEDGSEKSFFSLFKGGFRAITGVIGRVNKNNYRITTAAATIGVRGTDHETYVVTADSPLANAVPAGVYNKVNVGETYMTTDQGTIFVLANQMGFAGARDQMPQLQPLNTNLFTVAPAPAPQGKIEQKEGEKTVRDTAVVDPNQQVQVAAVNTPQPPKVDTFVIPISVNDTVTGKSVDLVAPPAPSIPTPPVAGGNGNNPTATNLNFMSAEYNSAQGSHNAFNTVTGLAATYDLQGILTAQSTYFGGGYLRMTAKTFEGGSDQGVIAWGRWAAGTPTLWGWGPQTLTADQGFHMVVGLPVITPPQLNGVAYVFIGGTRPTEATNAVTGNVWSVSGGSLTANFASNNLSANLNLGMSNAQGSSTYVMNVTGAANPTGFNPVAGSVVGNGASNVCTTACAASGTVMFAGAGATHAGMTYEFAQSNGTFVQGVSAFRH